MLLNIYLYPQSKSIDIQKNLDLLNSGRITEVNKELSKLMQKYPSDPGVLYLKARTTENGDEAIKIYSEIYSNYPKSEWSEHALYRAYQYYIINNKDLKSREKYNQLSKLYPKSKYLVETNKFGTPKYFYIQLGAFSTNENAKLFSDNISELGFNPKIIKKSMNNKTLYIVTIGNFPKISDAEKTQKVIEEKLDITSVIKSNFE